MTASPRLPRIIAIVGQTASGKTDLALDLAQHFVAPLISGDAMQLYRGLDVGTAKTPHSERRGIPHYQIDQLDVDEEASVAAYQKHARRDLEGSGTQHVVVAGGSGLYLRALLDRLEFPGHDGEVRRRLENEAQQLGPGVLYQRLVDSDPVAAQRIHPHNLRRVIRALEVIELTGRPFSATLPSYTYFYPEVVQVGIRWEQSDLDRRIQHRTEAMFREGIVEEARLLLDLPATATSAKATGYAEALAVLRGQMSIEEAIAHVSLATRQLSMRQHKWFKRDPRIHWVEPGENLLERVLPVTDFDNAESFS